MISGLGHGGDPLVVPAVALLLGLRHATDPDHLVAVSTLVVVAALLPAPLQRAAELAVGVVIMALAVRLYLRRHAGERHEHVHRVRSLGARRVRRRLAASVPVLAACAFAFGLFYAGAAVG